MLPTKYTTKDADEIAWLLWHQPTIPFEELEVEILSEQDKKTGEEKLELYASFPGYEENATKATEFRQSDFRQFAYKRREVGRKINALIMQAKQSL